LEKLEQEFDVSIHWRAFELRPAGSPPIPPQHLARIEASQGMLKKRARDEYGLELNVGPFGIDSRPALIADKYAEAQGKGAAFHEAVNHAYWQEARSIDAIAVLQEIAEQVGLDNEHFAEVLKNPAYDAAVSADIDLAREYGLTAVPALVFADKYVVMGAQPYATLRQIAEKILAENRE